MITHNDKQKEEKVFDQLKTWKPSLWQRIRLFFAKTYISYDPAYGKDRGVEFTFKKLGESIFLVKEKEIK